MTIFILLEEIEIKMFLDYCRQVKILTEIDLCLLHFFACFMLGLTFYTFSTVQDGMVSSFSLRGSFVKNKKMFDAKHALLVQSRISYISKLGSYRVSESHNTFRSP